jgi:DNA helicase HerA-like ATPase
MDNIIGRVVAVAGSQMTATLEVDALTEDPVRIGAMVKVRSAHLDVIGTIGTINAEGGGSPPRSFIVVDLLGEIVPSAGGRPQFSRGVTHYPVAGTPVRAAAEIDLTVVYTRPSVSNVSIGTLYHDPRRSAFVVVDELLAKNFAVLGATGSGKSCAVTLLLLAILAEH